MIPMPKDIDFMNAWQRCDMLVGPCACGSTHTPEERLQQALDVCAAEDLKAVAKCMSKEDGQ